MKFDKHIFICTNERSPESGRKFCGETHGEEIVEAFRKKLKEKNLTIQVRAQRAGCLDVCNYGQTIAIYPDGIFYIGVELSDVNEIIEEHIIHNRPVQRLILDKSKYD